MINSFQEIRALLSRITLSCLGKNFTIRCEIDNKYDAGRLFIQVVYRANDNKTGADEQEWKGRKYYLSEHMTQDEIVKTCYVAFEAAVKHEVMEGFKVDGIVLFNPHVNFEELLKVSDKEITRKPN
jgi:hypothetical protein